jgi:uncharacterized phage protein gp47/JayE
VSYVAPTISETGLTVPSYNDIVNFYIGQLQSIYGAGVVTDNSSADIQLLSILALAASDVMAALVLEYSNRAPNFSIGAALDSLVTLNGLARKVATASTVSVTLTGDVGAVINNGIVADTVQGLQWLLPATVTIGGGGTVTVTAVCATLGAVNIGVGTVTIKVTPTAGWLSVTNPTASVPGQPVESDSQLRTRQAISVALPSQTILSGTLAAIAAVPNVTRYQIDENTGSVTNGNGTPGHSIQAVVENGANADIAEAIFNNRGLGCGTSGTVTIAVTDPNTGLTMNINFNRPTNVNIYVIVNAHNQAGGSLTSAQIAAIQNGIVAYLNSLQMGQTISFGELVQAAALAVNANQNNPTVSIRSPFLFGTAPGPGSSADVVLAFGSVAVGLTANVTVNSV